MCFSYFRYEALILLVFYGLYIGLMNFNRKLDDGLNAWCLAHRDCCPRVIHDDVTGAELAAQSTGKFGGKRVADVGETLGLNGAEAPMANYSRLQYDDDEPLRNMNQTEVPDSKYSPP